MANFTGKQIRNTYDRIVQFNSGSLTDALGGALSASIHQLTVDTNLVADTSPQLGGNLDVNTKNIVFGDSGGATDDRLTFGAGTDLSIYHGGDQNYVSATGTGNLNLTSASSVTVKVNSTEDAIVCAINGAVTLYNNGNSQVATIDGGLNWQDSKKAEFGNSGDLKIYHESDVSIIKSASHPIGYYTNTRHHFLNADGSENLAVFTPNGSCSLYHNGDLRLQTWSDAVNIYGDEGEDAILHLYADEGDDPADKWRLLAGTAGQLDIANYSTGSWVNHLTISGSGYVTKQNHPSFRAGRGSSSQTVGSTGTIIFNTTAGGSGRHNNGNHYSTTTGKFTAPVSGVYTFFTHVIYQGMSDGDSMIDAFHIYVNNTQVSYSHKRSNYKAGYTGEGGYYTDTADFTGTLTAGDEVYVRHSQGTRTVHANTNYTTFSGFLVS